MVGCSDLRKIARFSGRFSLVEEYFLLPAALPEVVTALATLADLVAVKNVLGNLAIYSDKRKTRRGSPVDNRSSTN